MKKIEDVRDFLHSATGKLWVRKDNVGLPIAFEVNDDKSRSIDFKTLRVYWVSDEEYRDLLTVSQDLSQEDKSSCKIIQFHSIEFLIGVAKKGDRFSQLALANCYFHGFGVEQDTKQAVFWYQQAAGQGLATAQFNLGSSYYYGSGVAQDKKQAVFWYQQAAEQGLPVAQYHLGLCYYEVADDKEKAVYWYQKAAGQGFSRAQYDLGLCYENGIGGLREDKKEAVSLYRKAAVQGCADAQFNLGIYYFGSSLEAERQLAFEWFQKIASQGGADAQYNLGGCYEHGIGVEKNEKQAASCYQQAAGQGYADAQRKLALCYHKGFGLEADELEAVYWATKAVLNGSTKAAVFLDNLCATSPDLQKVRCLTDRSPQLNRLQVLTLSMRIVGKFLSFGWSCLPKNLCSIIVGYLSGIDQKDCQSDLLREALAQEYSQQLQQELRVNCLTSSRFLLPRNNERASTLIAAVKELEPSLISLEVIIKMRHLLALEYNQKRPSVDKLVKQWWWFSYENKEDKKYTQICGEFFLLFQSLIDQSSVCSNKTLLETEECKSEHGPH